MASLERQVSRDAEIRDATLELLNRFAGVAPLEPGQRSRVLTDQEVWRLDDVRAAMLAALQNG